jgi:hypothetical protein
MLDKIKKIKDRIYEFNFSNSELTDGNEIITTESMSEFVMTFKKRDLDKGVIVTPSGYMKGLVYKSTNGGEFYNNPAWIPDIVSFSLNVFGLKKGHFYKLTVVGRDTGNSNLITGDRRLTVNNEDKDLLIDENLKGIKENKEFHSIFRSIDNETNLLFKIGKIYITNIIIDEIELITDVSEEIDLTTATIGEGKIRLAAYGIFTTESTSAEDYKGRYLPMIRYSGKGVNLYLDKSTNQYVIERDNIEDTLGESFTNINYSVELNLNKVVSKNIFSKYEICEVNPEISPNTLKQGYIKFDFVDKDGKTVHYSNSSSRIQIMIYRLF